MKRDLAMYITTLTLLGVLAVPAQLAAQEKHDHPHQYHHYKLIDMGTFGGPQSYADYPDFTSEADVNNQGVLTGWADTKTPDPFPNFCFDEDCFVAHAFEWQNGVRSDLGVLPGGASSGFTVISKSGLIAGVSENGEIDPLIPGFPELRAVFWTDGKIRDLGVLPEGGYESFATAVNSSGLVAGLATNTSPDPNSMFGTGYQTRAFVWDKREGMQDLGTLGGTDAQALLVNERGQAVGWSYTSSATSAVCFPNALTTGSFLWDKENGMVNLGDLGGTCTEAIGLNNRGQVVGFSYLSGDQAVHAFLWDRATGLLDLGTLGGNDYAVAAAINDSGDAVGGSYLPGNVLIDAALWGKDGVTDLGALAGGCGAFAFGINNSRQVVGIAFNDCSFATTTGFLWEDGGPMVDLNTLIPGSGIFVPIGITISDRGEIAAQGFLPNGDERAVLLIPCDENHPGVEGCDYSLVDAAEAVREIPAPTMHKPTTTAPRTLRRFGRRGLAFANPTNLASPLPASTAETKCSGTGLSDDSDADHFLDSGFADVGYCGEVAGKLTGYCMASLHVGFGCDVKRVTTCPAGANAKKPGQWECCGFFSCNRVTVDLERACNP